MCTRAILTGERFSTRLLPRNDTCSHSTTITSPHRPHRYLQSIPRSVRITIIYRHQLLTRMDNLRYILQGSTYPVLQSTRHTRLQPIPYFQWLPPRTNHSSIGTLGRILHSHLMTATDSLRHTSFRNAIGALLPCLWLMCLPRTYRLVSTSPQ